ncbi:extensin-like [Haliotis rubra]|uniref:extensin-like n=1 Tax=Haliotis rubra TaxID=36100 RepID=UPI001EE50B9F|nr:extensin-like [Haliotis rubra]
MTGDDIVGQLQQWCIDQAAKSASDLKRLQGQMEGKIKDLEGRMNNLSINIATQVASDVNLRLENCMQQTKMDLQDFKSEIYQEIKTAVNEAIKKALLRAANPTGITVDDEQPSTPLPCESTPMPTNSTPLPECSLVEEQQAEPPRETRFVQSIDDIPTEWHATLLPFLPKEMPISERLNRVQVAFLNFLINKKDLKVASIPNTNPSLTPNPTPHAIPNTTPSLTPNPTPHAIPHTNPSLIPNATPHAIPHTNPSLIPNATPHAIPNTIPSLIPNAIPHAIPNTNPSVIPNPTLHAIPKH